MSKQTTVQWLHYHLLHLMQTKEWRSKDLHIAKFDELFVEALAMEREQIKESYKAGFNLRDSFNWECDAPWDTKEDLKHNEQEFDKYYNETYKGGEQ